MLGFPCVAFFDSFCVSKQSRRRADQQEDIARNRARFDLAPPFDFSEVMGDRSGRRSFAADRAGGSGFDLASIAYCSSGCPCGSGTEMRSHMSTFSPSFVPGLPVIMQTTKTHRQSTLPCISRVSREAGGFSYQCLADVFNRPARSASDGLSRAVDRTMSGGIRSVR
jgi:hypothetical protein